MEKGFIDYLYFIVIAIVGLIMLLSPRTFMGRAKYDEESLKTESLLKKTGIAIIVINIILIIYFILK